MNMATLLGTEFRKLRRCKVTWISLAAYGFVALACGFFIWIMKNPGLAESLGLIGQKARFSVGPGQASWATLFGMFAQMSGVGGMIMLSVVVTFVFGREYAEGTGKYVLVLPLRRSWLVLAKLGVAASWFALLSLGLVAGSLVVGVGVGLGGFSWPLFLVSAGRILTASALLLSLAPAVAWVAIGSRGYLAPLGYAIFTLVVGTLFGATDWAPWCPWSIVPLLTGAAGPGRADLGIGSYLVLGGVFVLGFIGTVAQLSLVDNVQ